MCSQYKPALVNRALVGLSAFLFDPIKRVGGSLVPFLLLILGMQLGRVSFRGQLLTATVATVLRLGVAVLIAFVLAYAMGLQGVTRQSVIVESGMPSAIFGVALAHEFDAAPELNTVIVSISTVASILTVAVLLAIV